MKGELRVTSTRTASSTPARQTRKTGSWTSRSPTNPWIAANPWLRGTRPPRPLERHQRPRKYPRAQRPTQIRPRPRSTPARAARPPHLRSEAAHHHRGNPTNPKALLLMTVAPASSSAPTVIGAPRTVAAIDGPRPQTHGRQHQQDRKPSCHLTLHTSSPSLTPSNRLARLVPRRGQRIRFSLCVLPEQCVYYNALLRQSGRREEILEERPDLPVPLSSGCTTRAVGLVSAQP